MPSGEFGFDNVLKAGIHRKHDVETIARGNILIAISDQLALAFVHFRFSPASDAAKRVVERFLDSGLPVLFSSVETYPKICAARRCPG